VYFCLPCQLELSLVLAVAISNSLIVTTAPASRHNKRIPAGARDARIARSRRMTAGGYWRELPM